jgi:hypothetical protein
MSALDGPISTAVVLTRFEFAFAEKFVEREYTKTSYANDCGEQVRLVVRVEFDGYIPTGQIEGVVSRADAMAKAWAES